jgi:hypothetical protein
VGQFDVLDFVLDSRETDAFQESAAFVTLGLVCSACHVSFRYARRRHDVRVCIR